MGEDTIHYYSALGSFSLIELLSPYNDFFSLRHQLILKNKNKNKKSSPRTGKADAYHPGLLKVVLLLLPEQGQGKVPGPDSYLCLPVGGLEFLTRVGSAS